MKNSAPARLGWEEASLDVLWAKDQGERRVRGEGGRGH